MRKQKTRSKNRKGVRGSLRGNTYHSTKNQKYHTQIQTIQGAWRESCLNEISKDAASEGHVTNLLYL